MAKRIRGPVQRGAVVNVHAARGGYRMKKAIVVGVVPPNDFSRAYGRQVFVCNFYGGGPSVSEVGAGDAVVVGKVKKLPAACKRALAEYRQDYAKPEVAASTRGRIEPSTVGKGTWLVKVDANELRVESGKKLPYPTTIGTINKRGTINVWSPAASKPRGYMEAARAVLKAARNELCDRGEITGCKKGR